MNEGLRALEMHPLMTERPDFEAYVRFQGHALAFARGMERVLEKRIARNIDRDNPVLAALAHQHLRAHQPFTRSLRDHLGHLGRDRRSIDWMRPGPRTRSCLVRAEAAIDAGSAVLTQALLVQGLECLSQLLARRGQDMAEDFGHAVHPFEERHLGLEGLLFEGMHVFERADRGTLELTLAELEMLFADAFGTLDEWKDTEPEEPPPGRARKRGRKWETGDLPGGGAA